MDLWDAGSAGADSDPASEEETLTVPQVGQRLQGMLRRAFPRPFWLVGEASEWDRTFRKSPRGHWYFRVVDDQDEGSRRASLNVKMWRGTVEKLFGPRGRLRGRLQPTDGVVLRLLVKPDFWPPAGQLSFTIEDVDPEHTLGNLDRQRRELLARLQGEGAHTWNPARELAEVPLRIGLVTSDGSAAHEDVLQTLLGSDLGFEVVFCDARTQGLETCRSVPAALLAVTAREPDVILLVRGGGSRVDLSWFDREEVARAVATCPVPVFTGIGHEIDSSVTDAMAHTACRTPTAAAERVVERVREVAGELELAGDRLLTHARDVLVRQHDGLLQAARTLVSASDTATRLAQAGLEQRVTALRSLAGQALARAEHRLEAHGHRLAGGVHLERLDHLGQALRTDAGRLARQAEHVLARAETGLESRAARLRLLDPRSVLARGYAYLRRADGRVLMDAADAKDAEALTAVLRDGELDLVAGEARVTPPEDASDAAD